MFLGVQEPPSSWYCTNAKVEPFDFWPWRPTKCRHGEEPFGSLKLAVRAFCLFRSSTAGFQRILPACPVLVLFALICPLGLVNLPLFMVEYSLWFGNLMLPRFGQVIDKYLREARAILAAAPEAGGGDAVAALGLVDAALELSPRMEAALELRARALLALRRYREVAEMLRDYIPSCGKACSGDDTSSSSSSAAASLLSSGSGDLGTISRAKLLSPDRHRSDDAEPDARPVRSFRCFDISELKRRVLAGLSKNPNTDTQWRYETLDI